MIIRIMLGAILVAGFGLRLAYALHSHPFFDEFTTILAAKMIWQTGSPTLPSGLFYEHGLLFSYLDAPFVGLSLRSHHVLFTVARWPSIWLGTFTIAFIYWVGQRWFSPWVGLVAAALLAFSPEGMVWGGRARMYALAQLLILVVIFLAYEGSTNRKKIWLKWVALFVLLLTLLTQFGGLLFVPPLVVGVISLSWFTRPVAAKSTGWRYWFQPHFIGQAIGLSGVVGLAVLVKRLGRPVGMAELSEATTNPLLELWHTLAYQLSLAIYPDSSWDFLARQFGVAHHIWLTRLSILGLLVFVGFWWRGYIGKKGLAYLFLWLVLGLGVLEMITLLEPFRRNPRYLVMGLPLFYLIAGASLSYIAQLSKLLIPTTRHKIYYGGWVIILIICLIVQGRGLWLDGLIAYRTPEPAYEEAFAYVADNWQPGDVILTMNVSAAALYLEQVNFFAIQDQAEQFLLNVETEPVDRWLGIPWVGETATFNQIINTHPRVWFVVDDQRLTTFGFYRGGWLALLNSQMNLVWEKDNALVYLTNPARISIPNRPTQTTSAQFGAVIALEGYTFQQNLDVPQLALYWSALGEMDKDYTIFIHLRTEANEYATQWDRQPLAGIYPTTQWQVGEKVPDLIPLPLPETLPAGQYWLAIGFYNLETLERLPVQGDTSGENAVILGPLTLP